jgi:hypothetical protein
MDSLQPRPNIMELAKKKRHIYLLEKLRAGTLSRSEISELKQYGYGLNPGYVATQEDLAKVFEVEPRTVRRWSKVGLPQDENGFNILTVRAWRESRNKPKQDEEILELTSTQLKDERVFGMRIGVMFLGDCLLSSTKTISRLCYGKDKETTEAILKQIIEIFTKSELNRDDFRLSYSED